MASWSLLVASALVTCFFSFLVQVGFYYYWLFKKRHFLKNHTHVFNYLSGVIGDAVLIPLTNVFALLILIQTGGLRILLGQLVAALLAGLLTFLFFHLCQQYFKQINWTMPRLGSWNILGLYHAIFMFLESSFLWYTLFSYLRARNLSLQVTDYFAKGWLMLFLFSLTFVYDYRVTLSKVFTNYYKKVFLSVRAIISDD